MTLAALPLLFGIDLHAFEAAVRVASGWSGILIIFVYSFLIAFVLPLPSEVVLCPVGYLCPGVTLNLGYPLSVQITLVIAASGLGKALGSLIALKVGHGATHSGPVVRAVRRIGFDPMEWSRTQMVKLVKRYGYAGMAIGLTAPGFPDTLSIYAFSVLEDDYVKFAAAAFTGSVGRLLVTIAAIESVLFVL